MSSAELNSAGQTSQQAFQQAQKVLDRLLVMPAMVGIDHMQQALASARSRVNDDHQRQKAILAKVAGTGGAATDPVPTATAGGEEDMGHFSIGDTFINIGESASAKPQAADPAKPPVPVVTDPAPKPPEVVVTDPQPKPPVTDGSGNSSTTSTTSTVTRIRDGIAKYVIPTLIGGGLVGGTMLFDHLTHKPDSVTTITNPSSGKFEYRYGIETHDRPKQ